MANFMNVFLSGVIRWFNKQSLILLLFIIGTANFIGCELYGGEEQYFAFAKQFMNPEWMPHSFALNHPAGGNLFFQIIIGFLLKFLSFEQMAFWGRLVNFFLYAVPLAFLFKHLKFTNIEAIIIFQLFYLPHQSIWAGEWVYKNLEEKSMAYIFVFFAVYQLLKGKPVKSAIFSAIATFFHFLVGGWFFLISVIYFIVAKRTIKEISITVLAYSLIVLPFVVYLGSVYFIDNEPVINGVNTNWIYAYFRLPNHIGIFRDIPYFKKQHLAGILTAVALFLVCVLYFRRFKRRDIQVLNTLNIIIFVQQFLFIGVAWFDKNGVLLKTYPFRTSALNGLFLWLEIGLIVKHYGSLHLFNFIFRKLKSFGNYLYTQKRLIYSKHANTVLLTVFLVYFSFETYETISTRNREVPLPDKDMSELIKYAETKTDKESVFLFPDDERHSSFIRRSNREKFVILKFTPTESKAIYEWYDRLMWKEKLQQDITLIDSVAARYRIDYVVSIRNFKHSSLHKEKTFGKYKLYEVIKDDFYNE